MPGVHAWTEMPGWPAWRRASSNVSAVAHCLAVAYAPKVSNFDSFRDADDDVSGTGTGGGDGEHAAWSPRARAISMAESP